MSRMIVAVAALAVMLVTSHVNAQTRGPFRIKPEPTRARAKYQPEYKLFLVMHVQSISWSEPPPSYQAAVDGIAKDLAAASVADRPDLERKLASAKRRAARSRSAVFVGRTNGMRRSRTADAINKGYAMVTLAVPAKYARKVANVEPGHFIQTIDADTDPSSDYRARMHVNKVKRPSWWRRDREAAAKPVVSRGGPAPVSHPVIAPSWPTQYAVQPGKDSPLGREDVIARAMPAVFTFSHSGGHGSGFVITEDGVAITNQHVVEYASTFTATFKDGRQARGTVIGVAREDQDLALVQLEGDSFPTLPLGSPDPIRVGQGVMVIGTPIHEDLGLQVTFGAISALHASWNGGRNLIQYDAATNAGSSGGPVLDEDGNVIGVHFSTVAANGERAEGMKLAVNVDEAFRLFPLLSN